MKKKSEVTLPVAGRAKLLLFCDAGGCQFRIDLFGDQVRVSSIVGDLPITWVYPISVLAEKTLYALFTDQIPYLIECSVKHQSMLENEQTRIDNDMKAREALRREERRKIRVAKKSKSVS
jgi:hypothetical protein